MNFAGKHEQKCMQILASLTRVRGWGLGGGFAFACGASACFTIDSPPEGQPTARTEPMGRPFFIVSELDTRDGQDLAQRLTVLKPGSAAWALVSLTNYGT